MEFGAVPIEEIIEAATKPELETSDIAVNMEISDRCRANKKE
jgi:hypothetical protein